MKGNRKRGARSLLLAAVCAMAGATGAGAQNVNVAGAWNMEVTTEAGGTTNPTMTLVQNGAQLTGEYHSETLGDAEVRGSVEGNKVTLNFTASLQGQDVPVTYVATVGADGAMTGTIDIAGGLATGTFSARRAP